MTDKHKAFQAILAKLEKWIPHLGNANPNEAAAALGKINKLLAGAKLDWHDLLGLMASPDKPSSLLDMLAKMLLGEAGLLIKLARDHATFFHHGSDAYADVVIDGHRNTWPLSGPEFSDWLLRLYYADTKMAPGPTAMKAALRT